MAKINTKRTTRLSVRKISRAHNLDQRHRICADIQNQIGVRGLQNVCGIFLPSFYQLGWLDYLLGVDLHVEKDPFWYPESF